MERVRLGITEEMVARTENHVDMSTDMEDTDSIASFTRGVTTRMLQEQPELWRCVTSFVHKAISRHGVLTFGYASALSYDMIPDHIRRNPLTTEQIDAAHRSIVESADVEKKGGRKVAVLNLDWCVQKLQADSPEYIDWLSQVIGNLEDDGDKRDFVLGSLVTVIPLYMREDSKILTQDLYNQETKDL